MHFDSYDDESGLCYRFTAYLEMVIKNAKIDYVRIYTRKYAREATLAAIAESGYVEQDFTSAMGFEEQGFDNVALDRAFTSLPEQMKKVLTCFYLHRMNAEEIGLVYGFKKNYVYQLKKEALKRLREHLRDVTEGGGCGG